MKKLLLCLVLLAFGAFSLRADVPSPGGGGSPSGPWQNWPFADTNWFSAGGYSPLAFTNIINVVNGGDGNCLLLDMSNAVPSSLIYNVVENDGTTNLSMSGALTFWMNTDWTDTNQGGFGPGMTNWARLIEVGTFTTNASVGWLSLYLSPDGTQIFLSGQTNNGNGATFLQAPVSFTAGTWNFIALNYGPTNSALYINGVLITNGSGVTYYPGPDVTANGFSIGSSTNGFNQACAMFDDLVTYNIQLDAGTIWADYNLFGMAYGLLPFAELSSAPSNPSTNLLGTGFDAVAGPGWLQYAGTLSGATNGSNVFLTIVSATLTASNGMTFNFGITGGTNGVPYDVFGCGLLTSTNARNSQWAWLGQGYTSYIYTLTNQPPNQVVYILGTPYSSTNDGLTDAYKNLVAKIPTNNPYANGQGILNGWSVIWGMNPATNYLTNAGYSINYAYDPGRRLKQITGTHSETISNDFEGNIVIAR